MSLLRKGSSRISEENFRGRLEREHAKTGAVTASLAWNDPSDLDLHARVILAKGGQADISYRNKHAAGGTLDVDMHAREGEEVDEPVENIFWKKPPAGIYSIRANLYKKRGERAAAIPFRALLQRDGEEDLSREGALENGAGKTSVECFRFTVDGDGEITMGDVKTPLPAPKATPVAARPMKSMKSMKVMKVMKKVKKVSTVAKGKKSKVQVFKGLKGKLKTKGGLKKEDLIKSKGGKIVSARASKAGKESKWAKATAKARAIKGYTGFKAIKKGGSFYEKAKEVLSEM